MRVATWNLENLFAPVPSGGMPGGVPESAPQSGPTTPEAYHAKLAALADTIASLDPDVMAVQEVGPGPVLEDLAAVIGGTWYTDTADPDEREIRVGLLSRHPLREVVQVRAFPPGLGPVQVDDHGQTLGELGRPALKATITADGRDVHVVSVHLKSKLLSLPDGRFSTSDEDERARYAVYALHRRAAEAAGVRAYATALLDQATAETSAEATTAPASPAVVIAGDFNDDPAAATTQILCGPPGSEIGTVGFSRPDAGDRQRLWNLAALIPEDDRYSRVYRGRHELIDHIFVSAALVHDVTTVDAGPGASPSITDDPDARRNEPGSDHRPVHATFSW